MSAKRPLFDVLAEDLSRRGFLKAAQVLSVGTAAAGLALYGREAAGERRARGTCRICTMHCGIVATTRGKRLVRVEGDERTPSKGFLCHHGQALREIVHSPDRVRAPLKRDGQRFQTIEWDRALEEIAGKLDEVKRLFGPEALVVQTGWPFVRHPFVSFLHRFCQAFGTPNLATVASLCEASGRMGRALVAGANFHPDLEKARTLIVWGANPTYAAPLFAHRIAAMGRDGKNLIVVDPVRTELAQAATLHLSVRPGTDGALALGMIHVLWRDGLVDKAYVEANTVGHGELRQLAETYDPERVQAITSVPAADVERAARLFATQGPGGVWDGLGIEHHENGVQTVRAVAALSALCGYLDIEGGSELVFKPGPGFFDGPLPQLYRMVTPEPAPPRARAKPLGYEEYPLYDVYNRQAQGMLLARAVLEDRPYPVRALILIGSNALLTFPSAATMDKVASKLSLLVTIDPFLSASASLSDYVLPASTFAEAGVVGPGEKGQKVERSGVVPEQGESRPDWKIVFDLARALGLGRFFPWNSFADAMAAPTVPFLNDEAHTLRARANAAPTPPRFPSETGKIELASPALARFGYDPLPVWREPTLRPGVRAEGDFPLYLVTGPRTRAYINSQFRKIPSIASKVPEPEALIHPEAARLANVKDREPVAIVSPHGRVVMRARITDGVHREVVVIPAGWSSASANLLTDPDRRDPISGFPAFRSSVCRVEPAQRVGSDASG